jgi:uncharacterized surface protein with fasciclin (FAS1) repeats
MFRSRLIRILAVAFAGVLVLGACGDDDSDDAADGAETTAAPATEDTAADADTGDIVATAAAAGDFTTLATALEAADLVETLQGEGPFTVFAPTDAAFEALPEGALDELLADPEALAAVLTYHVVEGEVPAADVMTMDGQEVETVNGETLTITIDGETVKVNDATVTQADVQASNGVIHVIDTVLLPPES